MIMKSCTNGHKMLERDVEKHLRNEVLRLGGLIRKYTSPGVQGVPDRIVFHQGRVYFVELKREGGVVSAQQRHEMFRMAKQGIDTCICTGIHGVNIFIEECIVKNFKHDLEDHKHEVKVGPMSETEVVVKTKCPICGRPQNVVVPREGYENWRHKGKLIQNALPTASADEREALMTGICSDCWAKL